MLRSTELVERDGKPRGECGGCCGNGWGEPVKAEPHAGEAPWREVLYRIFVPPDRERSWWEVIVWWESRRILYNVLVGVMGGASLILMLFFASRPGMLPPGEDVVEPMALIIAPILANICYTAGWVVELILRCILRERARQLGFWLLCLGFAFSLIVVTAPTVIWAFTWLAHGAR